MLTHMHAAYTPSGLHLLGPHPASKESESPMAGHKEHAQ